MHFVVIFLLIVVCTCSRLPMSRDQEEHWKRGGMSSHLHGNSRNSLHPMMVKRGSPALRKRIFRTSEKARKGYDDSENPIPDSVGTVLVPPPKKREHVKAKGMSDVNVKLGSRDYGLLDFGDVYYDEDYYYYDLDRRMRNKEHRKIKNKKTTENEKELAALSHKLASRDSIYRYGDDDYFRN